MLEANQSAFPPVCWVQMTHLNQETDEKTYRDTQTGSRVSPLGVLSPFTPSCRVPAANSGLMFFFALFNVNPDLLPVWCPVHGVTESLSEKRGPNKRNKVCLNLPIKAYWKLAEQGDTWYKSTLFPKQIPPRLKQSFGRFVLIESTLVLGTCCPWLVKLFGSEKPFERFPRKWPNNDFFPNLFCSVWDTSMQRGVCAARSLVTWAPQVMT